MGRSAVLLSFLIGLAAVPTVAHADSGTVGLNVGATALEQAGETTLHPTFRLDVGFRVSGPFVLGAFLTGSAASLPFDGPAMGGGLTASLRPDEPLFGWFVPSAEVAAARLQLPSLTQGRVDAWSTAVGAGLGTEIADGFTLEGRVQHFWYLGLRADADVGSTGWTATLGLAIDLP